MDILKSKGVFAEKLKIRNYAFVVFPCKVDELMRLKWQTTKQSSGVTIKCRVETGRKPLCLIIMKMTLVSLAAQLHKTYTDGFFLLNIGPPGDAPPSLRGNLNLLLYELNDSWQSHKRYTETFLPNTPQCATMWESGWDHWEPG